LSRIDRLRKAVRDRARRTSELIAQYTREARAGRWRRDRTEQLRRAYERTKDAATLQKFRRSRDLLRAQRDKLEHERKDIASSKHKLAHWRHLLASESPLRIRALRVANTLVGVMEHGGNNAGPMVSKIIRENGGSGPEPWCGDFTAYCYRHAGSTTVSRAWASAWALAGRVITRSPRPGDVVQYTFQHTGLFVRYVSSSEIETVEGNTGASGAVSDSSTGGDGVYRKRRSTGLVMRYVRVLR
jgi:hypothetical protein